jgi:hypothetical protein
MSAAIRKLWEIVARGLAVSARATAWRESLPWDDELPDRSRNRKSEHH